MRRDQRDGIELPDAAATARKVRRRRLKRRLKAVASLAIAAAAGTFIACKGDDASKHRAPVPPNPTTPADSRLPAPPDAAVDAAGDVPADASMSLVPAKPKDAGVDRDQHRKGMPVPDNLLE